ncbi:glycosyltransferase [Spirosoma sp. HMF4905]|uniref:Glycosyltransferase n=1 Tax=Spirosoma arboris TaxID=2682092 RepID=A0A7K1SFE7_9BACT|nr:glycosyltransferase family 2 protein [Spirosoma arboris]MVM32532.1 glycosyltransferase [Spirosoma arboris]
MNPLVSILIPMYNSEETIEETLYSCLNQTYNNIEIIIVDDGSSDNSLEIVKGLQASNSNIKLFRQERKGACRARNLAFKYSKGEYIQYLDADDILSISKIEEQMVYASTLEPFVLFSCKWFRFEKTINKAKKNYLGIYKNYNEPANWLVDSWSGNGALQTACWLSSRQLIEKAGDWNESLLKNQDGDFFCRVILNSKKIVFSNKAIVFYRDSGRNSISGTISYKSALSTLKSYEFYRIYIEKYNREDLRIALIGNYLNFYRYYYPLFPDLLKTAEEYINQSGERAVLVTSNKYLKALSKVFGFKSTIIIEKTIRRMLSFR